MAKYFSLSNATFADDFKAALEAYYGDGVTIESASGSTIIFQCPAVCDKVLKFVVTGGFNAFIGDTSASMIQFTYVYNGSGNSLNLILADSFILLDSLTSDHNTSALVAKLTNGRYMVAGGNTTGSHATYTKNNKCLFTDTMTTRPIRMICPYDTGAKSNGKLCLFPSYVADNTEVELNADGTFASIPGLWLATTTGAPVVGGNYYLSHSNLKGLSEEGVYCYTQKYVELEME